MVLVELAVWNLATASFFLVAVVYSNRLRKGFKGSQVRGSLAYSVYSLTCWAFVASFATFFLSFVFNLANFSPVAVFGVSVKDLGALISAMLFMASFRSATQFLLQRPASSVGSKRGIALPVLTRAFRLGGSRHADRNVQR
ncbi:MAG: hypothetical protein OK442_08075 [Thaumarchaeota archaeon]|nr:hypothetical protein [Nitrososphaerota archaeon]